MINTENNNYDISKEIGNLLPFDKYMQFTSNLINQMEITNETREHLNSKYMGILNRANDTELKLALIGQFSSGKSTFINALLGKRILKSAWKATTAIPTFIRYNENKYMVVHCKNGVNITATENNTFELSSIMKVWGCKVDCDEFVYLLQSVTSDVHSIKYVDNVEFFYPRDEISNNLCLIDTPGVNPGEEDASDHRNITKTILKEKSDAAIILFPATRVFTNDFGEFLTENAANIIHRCAFVITMMDLVEEDEREEIIEFVEKMLKVKFQIQNPHIFYCAAEKTFNDNKDEKSKYWCDLFYSMKDNLIKYIISQRGLVIVEQLIELLKGLLNEAKQDLLLNSGVLEEEEDNLNNNSIDKLDDVIAILMDDFTEKNTEKYSAIEKAIQNEGNKFQANINMTISKLLDEANFGTVQKLISNDLPSKIKNHQLNYNNAINKNLNILIKNGKDEINEFKKEFESFYTNLKAIDCHSNIKITQIALPKPESISFSNFNKSQTKENEKDKKNAKYGAGGGAAVGLMIGGPVGALVGAGIGALSTLVYSGTQWDKYRKEIENSTRTDVNTFIAKCKDSSRKASFNMNSTINSSMEQMVNSNREAYETTINDMILKHKEKIQNIKNKKYTVSQMQIKVDSTIKELEAVQKNIKCIN